MIKPKAEIGFADLMLNNRPISVLATSSLNQRKNQPIRMVSRITTSGENFASTPKPIKNLRAGITKGSVKRRMVREIQPNGFKSAASAIRRKTIKAMIATITAFTAQVRNKNERLMICIFASHNSVLRSPKIAVPTRTIVAPSSIATSKSCVMPIESSPRWSWKVPASAS